MIDSIQITEKLDESKLIVQKRTFPDRVFGKPHSITVTFLNASDNERFLVKRRYFYVILADYKTR